jgi:hypothetical protein
MLHNSVSHQSRGQSGHIPRYGSFLLAGLSHQNSPPSFQIESQHPKCAHNALRKLNLTLESKKKKTMKTKHLFLAVAALVAAGGLWLARSAWRSDHFASHKSSAGSGSQTPHDAILDPNNAASLAKTSQAGSDPGPHNRPKRGQMLRPPDPNRRFTDFTPEQRVQFARQGHGPGG